MSAEKIQPAEWCTVEDFFALICDGQKADLLDGVIHMASPDTPRNNRIANFIQTLLLLYVRKRGLGDVFASRVAFVVNEYRAPEPDVAFLSTARLKDVDTSRVHGGPDVAVEVVSRDSEERDYEEKRRLYQEAGVSEYWIIHPLKAQAGFFRLEGGVYQPMPPQEGRFFRSQAIEGFWLDVQWLFQDPLPIEYDCIQMIMAGAPRIQE